MHKWNWVAPSTLSPCSRSHCPSVRWFLCFSSPTLKYIFFVLQTQKLDSTCHITYDLLTRCNNQPKENSCNKCQMRQTFFWLFTLLSLFKLRIIICNSFHKRISLTMAKLFFISLDIHSKFLTKNFLSKVTWVFYSDSHHHWDILLSNPNINHREVGQKEITEKKLGITGRKQCTKSEN